MSEAWKKADEARARLDEAYLALKKGGEERVPDEELSKLHADLSRAATRFKDAALGAAPLREPSEHQKAIERTTAELQAAIAKAGA